MRKLSLKNLKWKDRYTYVKNVPFDEKDLKCKGSKFQIVKFKPGVKIEPHFHKKTYEIFYIHSGNGVLKINNKKYRCKPDDFFLCEPGDLHEFLNDTKKDFVILIFKTNEPKKDMFWK